MQKKILWVLAWVLFCIPAFAQITVTPNDAVETALKNSPAVKASGLAVRQNEQLIGSARNIPNPDITLDSPSGNFYTLGVQQNFRFPTVYIQQTKLQKQQVILAQKEQAVTVNDLKFRVRTAYLDIQFAELYLRQIQEQDSLFVQISKAAQRNFDAGTIDKLALIFAQTQAADLHNQLAMATQELMTAKKQLTIFIGVSDFKVLPLATASNAITTAETTQNPQIEAARQIELINQKSIEVEKANALPGFMIGYYNQGTHETNLGLRWRLGVSIPLWSGQYKSRITAARTGQEAARQRTESQIQLISADLQTAQGGATKLHNSLTFYETIALRQADDIINTAKRFFENGQSDYINFLRTANDAYAIKLRYAETLRNYNQSILTINYLTGTL